ncbi:hypothetical protein TIFTF001_054520 [Ficus carica]|uniref:Uncharacterized protein n=1 Tax=Ficus carica TaxID=3494 RepID=A0AA88EPT4_FICCA|nr:hypothetical protein TIFTF001_054520 [Ficus carica]
MTYLLLLGTNFTGKVPVELSHLSKLVVFFVSSIDTDIKLVELKLEQYVFKRMLQNLTNLKELILFKLDMVDVEPIGSLMNISSSLEQLYILSCQLRGNFPENIFRLPNLRELNLDYNFDLVGSLPTFNWSSSLTQLSLSGTKISIDLQYLMKSAKSLEILSLSNCSFQGSYPQLTINLTQLSQLTILDLSDNSFVGQLPEIDSTNSSQILVPLNLTVLSLSANSMEKLRVFRPSLQHSSRPSPTPSAFSGRFFPLEQSTNWRDTNSVLQFEYARIP